MAVMHSNNYGRMNNKMVKATYCSSSDADSDCGQDELGLRNLGYFYAPYLMHDIERLFLNEDSVVPFKSVWDDFESNGQDSDLDELDRLFRGMDHPAKVRSPAASVSAESTTSEGSTGSTGVTGVQQTMEDILTKAKLIEILRERERLQRLKPKKVQKKSAAAKVCVFCRNNGEAESVYSSHQLKDPEGNVTCPVLYIYTCPICGAGGRSAHTIKYCPYNTGDNLGINPLADLATEKKLMSFL